MTYKAVFTFLLSLTCFLGSCQQNKQPQIDYIIINDYLSARNALTPPVPANYKLALIDSLSNCRVEFYDQNNIIKENIYNAIGALYYTAINVYDEKNRIIKATQINEFENDTCNVFYQYKDSLDLTLQKKIVEECKANNVVEINYQYNKNGEQTGQTVLNNNAFFSKNLITKPNNLEQRITSYNDKNEVTELVYKYNDKKELIYEEVHSNYINKQFEYLYKYDKYGNWIERTKKIFREKQSSSTIKRDKNGKEIEPIIDIVDEEIREKLVRNIYYK